MKDYQKRQLQKNMVYLSQLYNSV
nr:unnamed protein product [Callosobruchus analis]